MHDMPNSPTEKPLQRFEVELRCPQTGFHQGYVEVNARDLDDATVIAAELYPGCIVAEALVPDAA
jgi:hypothetical protein